VLPVVALDPVASPIIQGGLELAATASDNVGVAKVEFYVNNVFKGEVSTASAGKYRFNADDSLLNGQVVFSAKAFDAAGNSAQSSQNATVAIVVSFPAILGPDLDHTG
jgi:chitinase